MIRQPLISIGITCFNSEKTILKSLNSALKQTWVNKEIIIVDDYSNDNTINLIKEYIEKYKNFKLLRHDKNYGYPHALNTIIKNSSGEYIAIFDSDDESKKERIEKQYYRLINYSKEHKTSDIICYSNRKIIKNETSYQSHIAYAIGRKGNEPYGEIVAELLLGSKIPQKNICWGIFGSCTMFLKKSIFEKLGYFDIFFRRGAEHDFAIRAAFNDFHFIAVNEPLIIQNKTIANYKSKENVFKYSIALNQKYKNYLISKNSYYGSIFLTLNRNYYYSGNYIKSYFFYFIALLFLPLDQKILRIKNSKLIKKVFLKF